MTGGMELAGMTSAAIPEVFNPATVGGLAESIAASNAGLAGLNAGAGALAPQFSMSAPELFNPATEASATDPLQLPQEGAKETLEGVDTSEKLGSMDTGINAAKGLTGNSTIDDLINLAKQPNWSNIKDFANNNPKTALAMGLAGLKMMQPKTPTVKQAPQYIRPYVSNRQINPNANPYQPYSNASTSERNWFTGGLEAQPVYRAAAGGLTALAVGGPVEQMSAINSTSGNTMYPMAGINTPMYSNPMMSRPQAINVIKSGVDTNVDPYTGEEKFAVGGLSNLGDYSDGGRLLRGPGDGVSDSIPASIGDRRPARLADGEFVVPARIVSELGNGSTEAGARKLYAMMDRVQNARKKSVGQKKVAVDSKADKLLPA
jgi:hypothetical protein